MSSEDARETAWRIHGAVGEWTGQVDAKASFALKERFVLAGVFGSAVLPWMIAGC
ncbi:MULTISPECIES: hypothetical protein [unclassified Streptomyces]|uniref:hypothetical protein n=1 Tax=unclassified Streptomyces TaxID=2593676 RepID=UPI0036E56A04